MFYYPMHSILRHSDALGGAGILDRENISAMVGSTELVMALGHYMLSALKT